MENEAMLDAEDLGFDAEDLKEAGLDNQEPATPAGNDPKKTGRQFYRRTAEN